MRIQGIFAIATILTHVGWAESSKSRKMTTPAPEVQFAKTVQPLLSSYCVGCHNPKYKQANIDLAQLSSMESVKTNSTLWRKVAWRIEVGDMPPEKTPQPKLSARKAAVKWIRGELAKITPQGK